MTLSIYIAPTSSINDTYAVYVSFGINATQLEPPTETKFDLLFVTPNSSALSVSNSQHDEELKYTIFMPPTVHLGNGTYIFGIKLISKCQINVNIVVGTYRDFLSFSRFECGRKFIRIQLQLPDEHVRLKMSILG